MKWYKNVKRRRKRQIYSAHKENNRKEMNEGEEKVHERFN